MYETADTSGEPGRLSHTTHILAERALSGEHGRAMKNADFGLDEDFVKTLTPNMHYAESARLVAQKAPLRILPGELIVGSATLREAAIDAGTVPVFNKQATHHVTFGFDRVLKMGYRGLRQEIEERLVRGGLDERGVDLLKAMLVCLDAAAIWHRRYVEALEEEEERSNTMPPSLTFERGDKMHPSLASERGDKMRPSLASERGDRMHPSLASERGDRIKPRRDRRESGVTYSQTTRVPEGGDRKCQHLDGQTALTGRGQDQTFGALRSALKALRNVPENPPATFHEAAQSLWFMFAFHRLLGNHPGIGRIDEMLGPYLKRDLAEGRTTLDEAREIIAHFWIKGAEWVGSSDFGGTGDSQYYQNIVLGGIDADGNDITNEVTYLVLDVVEELHIGDFPIAVRVSKRSPERLLQRIAEVQRRGGGIVAIYNEDVVIAGMLKMGYSLEEARRFANDGCWEAQVPGKTYFVYYPFDMLGLLQRAIGLENLDSPIPDYADFEECYGAFRRELALFLDGVQAKADGMGKSAWLPCPWASMFIEDCIERGRSYYEGGARYHVWSPHAGGMANAANSLLVIQKLVYEEKMMTLPEFVHILRSDYEGQENLRRLILGRFEFYGCDNEEADAMVKRLFDDFTDLAWAMMEREGVMRPPGISTFGREILWRNHGLWGIGPRQASADGHHKGEYLATNFSPSPGTDKEGPTAAINSYCKMDFTKTPTGATLELKLDPKSVEGESGIQAMVGLTKSFIRQGGWFLQTDTVDSAMLIDAQQHPEKYPNLPVRVSGWSARFVTLNKEWQDMIINRTQQIV